jgi:ATP-dependent protease Clp ATPase subunit
VRGFTINEHRLREQGRKPADLRKTVGLLEKTLENQVVGIDEAKGVLQVIAYYSYALTTRGHDPVSLHYRMKETGAG